MGLPGQQNRTPASATAMASIQPPLAIPSRSPSQQPAQSKPVHSVAGPQDRRAQGGGKGRSRNKAKKGKRGEPDSKTSSDESGRQSSDSESLSGASEMSLSRWSTQRGDGARQKGRSWQQGRKGIVSSSESEISDGDATGSSRFKSVWSKIRHEALSCLAVLFQVCSPSIVEALLTPYLLMMSQVLDRHTAFSYWLSFLPDGPRPPNSPPLLLTCVLKDPVPKVRSYGR